MPNEQSIPLETQRKTLLDALMFLKSANKLDTFIEELFYDRILEIDWEQYDLLSPGRKRPDSEIKITFIKRDREIMLTSAKETFAEAIKIFDYERVRELYPVYFESFDDGVTDLALIAPNVYLRTDFDNFDKRRRLKAIASKFGEEIKVVLSLKGSKTIIN